MRDSKARRSTSSRETKTIPFTLKLLRLFEEEPSLIQWREGAILIPDPKLLEKKLPQYFRSKNYTSFQRQLNNFGFNKLDKTSGPKNSLYVKVKGEPMASPKDLLTLRPIHATNSRKRKSGNDFGSDDDTAPPASKAKTDDDDDGDDTSIADGDATTHRDSLDTASTVEESAWVVATTSSGSKTSSRDEARPADVGPSSSPDTAVVVVPASVVVVVTPPTIKRITPESIELPPPPPSVAAAAPREKQREPAPVPTVVVDHMKRQAPSPSSVTSFAAPAPNQLPTHHLAPAPTVTLREHGLNSMPIAQRGQPQAQAHRPQPAQARPTPKPSSEPRTTVSSSWAARPFTEATDDATAPTAPAAPTTLRTGRTSWTKWGLEGWPLTSLDDAQSWDAIANPSASLSSRCGWSSSIFGTLPITEHQLTTKSEAGPVADVWPPSGGPEALSDLSIFGFDDITAFEGPAVDEDDFGPFKSRNSLLPAMIPLQ